MNSRDKPRFVIAIKHISFASDGAEASVAALLATTDGINCKENGRKDSSSNEALLPRKLLTDSKIGLLVKAIGLNSCRSSCSKE
jgi:hypothetical protein